MTVCERIDDILRSKKMSRRKLAIQAGIPPSSLQSAMERNKGLSLDMLFPISDVLGVDPSFLDTGVPARILSDEEIESMEQRERNVRNTKAEALIKIANALDCDVWELSGAIKAIPRYKMDELLCGIDSLHFDVNFPILKKYFEKLNATGQEVAIERLKELTEIPKYRREEGEQGAVDPKENE